MPSSGCAPSASAGGRRRARRRRRRSDGSRRWRSPSAATKSRAEPRYLFFAGKGGVGKTTCAAASALAAAAAGRAVLAVSTDPAHSLADALAVPLGAAPRRLAAGRGRLWAAELEADAALERWFAARRPALEAVVERGTYLDREDVGALFGLAAPGVDELVGLVELRRLAAAVPAEEVVVDTAPSGHTLRLLAMPESLARLAAVLDAMQAKHRALVAHLGGRLGADAGEAVIAELADEAGALRALLRDPARAQVVWVTLPEPLAVAESRDGLTALGRAGIAVREIVVNRVTPPRAAAACPACAGRVRQERAAIRTLRAAFPGLPLRLVPRLAPEPRGRAALRRVGLALEDPRRGRDLLRGRAPRGPAATGRAGSAATRESGWPPPWLRAVAPARVRLLLFGGKGGVGKTTCAAAAALALARAEKRARVLLLSTDPAHSLADVLGAAVGDVERPVQGAPPNLWAREIDAAAGFAALRQRHRRRVEELFARLRGGSRFDAPLDRAVLERLLDLAPPGIDELLATLAVVAALEGAPGRPPYDRVVLDTAPTGHALRLLDLPALALEWVHAALRTLLKYQAAAGLGEAAAELLQTARELRALRDLLRDPAGARFVVVTHAAELPRLETERLVAALAERRLAVGAVVVNAVADGACAACRSEARAARRLLGRLRRLCRRRCSIIVAPAISPAPAGVAPLLAWTRSWSVTGDLR